MKNVVVSVIRCGCGETKLISPEGIGICFSCFNAIMDAKNVIVQELFEARQEIGRLKGQLHEYRSGNSESRGCSST